MKTLHIIETIEEIQLHLEGRYILTCIQKGVARVGGYLLDETISETLMGTGSEILSYLEEYGIVLGNDEDGNTVIISLLD